MSRAGDHAVEVELVEDEVDPDGVHLDIEPRPGRRPPTSRVPRRVWLSTLAVAGIAVAGVGVGQRLDDAALTERLAEVRGLSRSLGTPLHEAWRAPAATVVGSVDDAVVVMDAQGTTTSALDTGTGAVRYSRPGWCQLLGGEGRVHLTLAGPGGGAGALVDDAGPAHLLCTGHAADDAGPEDRPEDGLDHDVDHGRVRTLAHVHDPTTGARLRTVDLGAGASWSTIGPDVVALRFGADDHLEAARWSLATGEPVWAYRSPDPLPRTDSWGSSFGPDVVRLEIGDWALDLDPDTGERVEREPRAVARDSGWGPFPVAGGGTATTHAEADGPRTTVLDAAGSVRLQVAGLLVPPAVDDGSASDVLLLAVTDGEGEPLLRAVDVATGAVRWDAAAPADHLVLLDGTVVAHDGRRTVALDARTGATRWTASTTGRPGGADAADAVDARGADAADGADRAGWDGVSGTGMVTDGRQVVTLARSAAGWALVARDVASGAVAWTSPSPVDRPALELLADGTVVVVGDGELVALRS